MSDLRPILRKWVRLVAKASAEFEQRRTFYFLEQSFASLLSTAGWTLSIPSVIEARCERGNRNARTDVLLSMKPRTIIEMKICWFGDTDSPRYRFRPAYERARREVSMVSPTFAPRAIAAAIGVLERGGEPLRTVLQSALDVTRDLDFRVWDLREDDRGLYPGWLCAGTVVRSRPARAHNSAVHPTGARVARSGG